MKGPYSLLRLIAIFGIVVSSLIGFWALSQYSYVLFHTIVEVFCIVIAACVFILVWNTRKTLVNGYLVFIGIGQLFMAILDTMHAVSYKDVQMFPGYGTNLPTQLWIASRYFLVVSLLIAPVFFRRKFKLRVVGPLYGVVFLLLVAAIFGGVFPDAYLDETGMTDFKRISEYVISGLFVAGLVPLIVLRDKFDQVVHRWLLLFFAFNILAEILFSMYISVVDVYNVVGHLFKLTAYFSLYKAIVETGLIRPYTLLYIDLARSEQQLRQSRDELQSAYDRLSETNSSLIQAVREREEARNALDVYTKRLEQSNRDLEQFAFVASHDLQEPLRKIKSFGDRLQSAAADKLDEEHLDFLNRMVSASQRLQLMIQGLLELSRVNTTRRAFESVDLNQVAAEVVSDLDIRLTRSGGRVEVEHLPCIQGDPIQTRQLLQNLIGNAIKFCRPGVPPVVQVRAREYLRDETPFIELSIADNGIGFDEQYSGVLFVPFRRLHGRSEYEGSGMGLAICKKIVERHGGTISVHSTPDSGTTFYVSLPVDGILDRPAYN